MDRSQIKRWGGKRTAHGMRDERALIAKLNNPMPPSTQVAGSGTGTTVSRKGLVAEWTGSEPTSTPALEYFKIEDEPDPTT